jgi:hypothetical protein
LFQSANGTSNTNGGNHGKDRPWPTATLAGATSNKSARGNGSRGKATAKVHAPGGGAPAPKQHIIRALHAAKPSLAAPQDFMQAVMMVAGARAQHNTGANVADSSSVAEAVRTNQSTPAGGDTRAAGSRGRPSMKQAPIQEPSFAARVSVHPGNDVNMAAASTPPKAEDFIGLGISSFDLPSAPASTGHKVKVSPAESIMDSPILDEITGKVLTVTSKESMAQLAQQLATSRSKDELSALTEALVNAMRNLDIDASKIEVKPVVKFPHDASSTLVGTFAAPVVKTETPLANPFAVREPLAQHDANVLTPSLVSNDTFNSLAEPDKAPASGTRADSTSNGGFGLHGDVNGVAEKSRSKPFTSRNTIASKWGPVEAQPPITQSAAHPLASAKLEDVAQSNTSGEPAVASTTNAVASASSVFTSQDTIISKWASEAAVAPTAAARTHRRNRSPIIGDSRYWGHTTPDYVPPPSSKPKPKNRQFDPPGAGYHVLVADLDVKRENQQQGLSQPR